MKIDFTQGQWLNPPRRSSVTSQQVEIVTDPHTDFWQRTYYGFRNDNGHALLGQTAANFTFTAKAAFEYRRQFDQCGLMVYLDSDNWYKASVEYEDASFARLGSVVTNLGHSDWATSDIATPPVLWYRLSRRGPDFLLETSPDGRTFQQMRIFHLHLLGETTAQMGQIDPPVPAERSIRFGMYACSPNSSSFTAQFTDFALEDCRWPAHGGG